jgi:hypothetical protein
VQFSAVEEATRALEALNGTKVRPLRITLIFFLVRLDRYGSTSSANAEPVAVNVAAVVRVRVPGYQLMDRIISVEYVARGSVESR